MSDYKFEYIDVSLLSNNSTVTGFYLCTWHNQGRTAKQLGITGKNHSEWRDVVNQDLIFGETNYYHIPEKDMRTGIIFLLDDGWDVPYGTANNGDHYHNFGSIDPDPEKFSQFGDTPVERLKGISKKVKELGYAGLGLWISPKEKDEPAEFDMDRARAYWEERAKWCHEAGVLYWKVDWGSHHDDIYREMMSDCVKRFAPGLLVEHAVVQLPLTHNNPSKNFLNERAATVKEQMKYSDVYRTYDITRPFENVTTLLRAHEALIADPKSAKGRALINGEFMYSICSTLGICSGIMEYDNDAAACIKWQRISPPFSIKDCDYTYSDNFLEDTLFCETELCSWAPCKGLTVRESAPAIMARNCPLPKVVPCDTNAPFIVASKNPKTNAYAVGSIKRTVDPIVSTYFLADVTVSDAETNAPIGIFGMFNSLTVEFNTAIPENARVLAQDLLDSKAVDITNMVSVNKNTLTIDGKILRMVGKLSRPVKDKSDPSLVLKIVND